MNSFSPRVLESFKQRVWEQGLLHARCLPWRQTRNSYAVLVSEVMLQQTRVERVLKHWEPFLGKFPTPDALAAAETSFVLEAWQGLGYNRRALALKRAAELCAGRYGGELPQDYEELLALPGVGPATAAGITVFARNLPCVYLETNVRTVFLHELFPDEEGVKDSRLIPLLEKTCPVSDPRSWYYALLDYGTHLKKVLPNPSRRSAHHNRQSKFEGSRRQKRAAAVRIVLGHSGASKEEIQTLLDEEEAKQGRGAVAQDEFDDILATLEQEGFFSSENGSYRA